MMWRQFLWLRAMLVRLLEIAAIIAMAFLVFDVLWGVFTRFLLNSPSRWTEEVAAILLIWVALLGAAVAFGRKEHLGMDYLVKQLNPEGQKLAALVCQLIIICFSTATLVWGGYELVSKTLFSGQPTPALGMRMGYVYLAVPGCGAFIVSTLACLMFGTISGSATAAVSSVGGMMIPEMINKGYSREYSVAITTAAATTGLVIPPSNIMIVFAIVAGDISVASMFMARIIPGIIVGLD